MDFTGIVAALITGVVTLLGVVATNSKSQAVMGERIDSLRRDLEDIKEQYKEDHDLREKVVVCEQSIKAMWKRVDEHTEDIAKLKEDTHA